MCRKALGGQWRERGQVLLWEHTVLLCAHRHGGARGSDAGLVERAHAHAVVGPLLQALQQEGGSFRKRAANVDADAGGLGRGVASVDEWEVRDGVARDLSVLGAVGWRLPTYQYAGGAGTGALDLPRRGHGL